MTTPHQDDRLDTMLQELGPSEPPAGFADSVLAKVARTSIEETRTHASSNVVPFSSGGSAMAITRKAMWGLAAAAAIILAGFMARGGFPTVDRGTEGAIGAAKKYQAPQLAASDVVTGDASVQEFLQSDTFDRLIKDPEAVALLSNAALRDSLSHKQFADAIRSSAVRDNLRNGVLTRIYDSAAARSALEDALKADLHSAVRNLDARVDLSAQMRTDLKMVLGDANLRPVLASAAFRDHLANTSLRDLLMRSEVKAALNNPNFVAALANQGFSAAVRSDRFAAALSAH